MKKITKLKICDRLLLLLLIVVLASGIRLEFVAGRRMFWVWLHIVSGTAFMCATVWHLYLHFNWSSWLKRLRSQKSSVTQWLTLSGALTFVTALAALAHWFLSHRHFVIGGVHGKLGFVFVAFAVAHTVKRRRFLGL